MTAERNRATNGLTRTQNRSRTAKKRKSTEILRPAREGSKAAQILELLQQPNGASLKELTKATGWQPHSIRGFLSGTIRKKMKLPLTSTTSEDGLRRYRIKT